MIVIVYFVTYNNNSYIEEIVEKETHLFASLRSQQHSSKAIAVV